MMKLKHTNLWIVLVLLLGFAACNDSDKDDLGASSDLSVTPLSVRFKDDKTTTVTVDYDGTWEASLSDTTWCSLDKISGRGKGEIIVTLKPRAGMEVKYAKLVVRATDAVARLHVVELLLDGENFYADPIAVEFGLGDNTSYTVDVVCDGKWTAELGDDSWCSVDKTFGEGNGQIKVTSNFDLATSTERSTLLTITSVENPDLKTIVDVKQANEFKHGGCLTLQKATRGKGINLVFTGDGFVKEDMVKNGHWQQTMEKCREKVFKYEPFASFREYFNIYAVPAVSETSTYLEGKPGDTFFGCYYTGHIISLGRKVDPGAFAYEHSPVKDADVLSRDLTVLLIINENRFGGVANVAGGGPSVGLGGLWDGMGDWGGVQDEDPLSTIVTHEFIGHAFGKLADQYYAMGDRVTDKDQAASEREKEQYGHWQNIEFTSDRTKFYNQTWRKLLDMGYPGVGVYQGGLYCEYGVYRSVEDDIMRNEAQGNMAFGPVNRELILRRIYKLAGMESEYSFDVFLEYDKKNK